MKAFQVTGDSKRIYFKNYDRISVEQEFDNLVSELKEIGCIVYDKIMGPSEDLLHCNSDLGGFSILVPIDAGMDDDLFIYSDDPEVIDNLMEWFNRDNS